ncbi:hypothetical protein [Streptomyces sp. NRRL S-1868]|uniref:hypothetical protein n=1 Tax=Streptomyces sp. NRRL S-1868 TaxID=1463892 RepID=UPI00068BDD03|nr:hypothetical protein [Streptomyces sp. NRRL S-1868]
MSATQTAHSAAVHLLPLAEKDLDENKVTPGVLGFIVFAVIGLAVWMLMKSMNKHMHRVDFEEGAGNSGGGNSGGAASADVQEAAPATAGAVAASASGAPSPGKKQPAGSASPPPETAG